jgi:hypothetical protein
MARKPPPEFDPCLASFGGVGVGSGFRFFMGLEPQTKESAVGVTSSARQAHRVCKDATLQQNKPRIFKGGIVRIFVRVASCINQSWMPRWGASRQYVGAMSPRSWS